MKPIFVLALSAMMTASANAHFVWLAPGVAGGQATGGQAAGGQATVNVYFGEDAADTNSDYLSRVKDVSVFRITGSEEAEAVVLTRTDDSISTSILPGKQSVYVATHDLGVMDRGDSTFRLLYYAKTGPDATSPAWQSAICVDDLKLDIVPTLKGGKVSVKVFFNETPVANAEVNVGRPGGEDFEAVTDKNGLVTFDVADAGLYSIRARHVEAVAGEVNGKAYPETRHYSTVSLQIPGSQRVPGASVEAASLQDLPLPVTSFGAAVVGEGLYMYGGHTGGAHSYSMEEQSNELTRLDLKTGQWDTIIEGPHLQGLALVTDGHKLYRIGGFTAMNADGEDHQLVSQNSVACFDHETNDWTELPALPERRSSHDAAVIGDCIYVVGGWAMDGEDNHHWHDTAWKLDLKQKPLHWQPIATPPFKRRAIAAAAHGEKLYVVGGMQDEGGPTTKVAVYDPESDAWAAGPEIYVKAEPKAEAKDGEKRSRNMAGGAMAGFGASAFATGGALYVTTVQGNLQRLSADASKWEVVSEDISPRFFHRLLPMSPSQLVVVGGSNMKTGKFEKVEVLDVTEGT